MTSSSLLSRRSARLLKKFPRIGISPNTGTFEATSRVRLSIKPAIAKLWPSRNSTSVSARRVDNAGIKNPDTVTAFEKSSELTSGATFRRIVPSLCTLGVNLNRTPNSLNRIVTA